MGQSKANIKELLKNCRDIKTKLDINIDILIKYFNDWAESAKTDVSIDNISQMPVDFF